MDLPISASLQAVHGPLLPGCSSSDPSSPLPVHSRGVDLIRVEYIPDNKATIKEALLNLKQRVGPQGFVFTSGGIGPTHDDVTYEAIAEALGKHCSPCALARQIV